jgi:hypothetical protein
VLLRQLEKPLRFLFVLLRLGKEVLHVVFVGFRSAQRLLGLPLMVASLSGCGGRLDLPARRLTGVLRGFFLVLCGALVVLSSAWFFHTAIIPGIT